VTKWRRLGVALAAGAALLVGTMPTLVGSDSSKAFPTALQASILASPSPSVPPTPCS